MKFDATLKDLLEAGPADWLRWFGLPIGEEVRLVDADLSTVSTLADKVIWVGGVKPYILHLEFQASRESLLGRRLIKYNVLLVDRHEVPVHTLVVLLRPAADASDLTGQFQTHLHDGRRILNFDYDVVRLWQQPIHPILTSGLATLPLALLSDVEQDALPSVVQQMDERLLREATPDYRNRILSASFLLMGLRYPPEFADQLFSGVHGMEESTTYQAIVAKARKTAAKELLLRMGRSQFGAPTEEAIRVIEKIDDFEQIEQLCERSYGVSSWKELLEHP